MRISKAVKALFFTSAITLAGSTTTVAQVSMPQQQAQGQADVDFSEEQLKKFVSVAGEVSKLQQGFQQQMMAAIQEEGLTPQEFQTMAQNQQSGEESTMSAEKQENFSNAMSKVMSMQQEMNKKMESIITEKGMTMQEYQQMAMQIQQSPELSKKVQEMMQK
ncbi:MAG: DUF4168 domain-containing protein [Owenweeksia sp.]|nr:DUF4168 domain-containing protein [Owenweeksia sp.]